ncbi:MAG: SpoIIE family protein phosphatase [Planctomycetes bacterium]|nr:SpoIIE family protein phosphatase [Planctomycetota bacterium]
MNGTNDIKRGTTRKALAEQLINKTAECERIHALLNLQREFLRTLTVASSLNEVAGFLLEQTCNSLGWDFGAIWTLDRRAQVLRCIEAWSSPSLDLREFLKATREQTFPQGRGLPGLVWADPIPVSLVDLSTVINLPRITLAAKPGLESGIVLPIRRDDEFQGVVELFSRERGEPVREISEIAVDLCSQIGQLLSRSQLENSLRREQVEGRAAARIQRALLPRGQFHMDRFQICGASRNSFPVGGDVFDILPWTVGGQEEVAVLIADASGHGLAAALIASLARAYVRAFARSSVDAGKILTSCNQELANDLADGAFVTSILLRLNPVTGTLAYGNAGHCAGFVMNAHGDIRNTLSSTGFPLGLVPQKQIDTVSTLPLEPGDLLILYSDGITESFSPQKQLFGTQRLIEVVRSCRHEPPDRIVAGVFNAQRRFAENQLIQDDSTVVIVKAN